MSLEPSRREWLVRFGHRSDEVNHPCEKLETIGPDAKATDAGAVAALTYILNSEQTADVLHT